MIDRQISEEEELTRKIEDFEKRNEDLLQDIRNLWYEIIIPRMRKAVLSNAEYHQVLNEEVDWDKNFGYFYRNRSLLTESLKKMQALTKKQRRCEE